LVSQDSFPFLIFPLSENHLNNHPKTQSHGIVTIDPFFPSDPTITLRVMVGFNIGSDFIFEN